jgi:tetratricopeptide (TPR) repeat protein
MGLMKSATSIVLVVLASLATVGDRPVGPPFASPPAHPVTDAQLTTLQRRSDETPDSDPQKPDILFSQAELYVEMMRYDEARAGTAADERVRNEYRRKQTAWMLAAVKRCLEIADNPKFGQYRRNDEVLFQLAYLLLQAHREDAARKYFKRLMVEYPRSKLIPDAFVSFGDYYFELADLATALKFYDRALSFPESRVYDYARYKTAWAELRRSACAPARAGFTAVAASQNSELAIDARRQLDRLAASGCL